MNLRAFLEKHYDEIVQEASQVLTVRPLKNYSASGKEVNKERIIRLFNLVLDTIESRNLIPMMEYAEAVASERFKQGFDLDEVIAGFNVLEEIIWKKITQGVSPNDYPEAFGLVSTVIGFGKEHLSVTYVALVSNKEEVVSLDMTELFQGI